MPHPLGSVLQLPSCTLPEKYFPVALSKEQKLTIVQEMQLTEQSQKQQIQIHRFLPALHP